MDLWTPNNDIAVSIGGKPLFSFKSLRLHQPINDHHRFELALDFEVAAKALEDGTEWLGKRIQIKRREAKSPLFVGVVNGIDRSRSRWIPSHDAAYGPWAIRLGESNVPMVESGLAGM